MLARGNIHRRHGLMPAQRANGRRAKRKREAPSADSVNHEEGPSTRRNIRAPAAKAPKRARKEAQVAPTPLSDCSSSLSSPVPSDVVESDEDMEWEEVDLAEAQVNGPQISSTSEGGNLDLTLDKSKNVMRLK